MPPRLYSRHSFCAAYVDDVTGALALTDREPFPYQVFPDNVQHIVADGDTLAKLAARYYATLPRPSGLWWVIADFQPTPITDPTIAIEPGTVIVVPSVKTVLSEVFAASRQSEATF